MFESRKNVENDESNEKIFDEDEIKIAHKFDTHDIVTIHIEFENDDQVSNKSSNASK